MSKAIIFIGATGEGKTTGALNLIKKSGNNNIFVFDYRGESAYDELATDLNAPRCKFTGKPTDYLEIARRKPNTWLLIEEATIFFNGRSTEELREILVSKRHRGHNIIFLFHTIGTVPPFILDMADYICLYRTGDTLATVKKKRDKLIPYFVKLQRMPKYSRFLIKNI